MPALVLFPAAAAAAATRRRMDKTSILCRSCCRQDGIVFRGIRIHDPWFIYHQRLPAVEPQVLLELLLYVKSRWMDGWMAGWMAGWMGRWIELQQQQQEQQCRE